MKKAPSSPNHDHIISNLNTERRKGKGINGRIAHDIINFLHVEDANLGVIFLTLECEVLPSKVHESEAMRDVMVLLHKGEHDYNIVMEELNEKSEAIASYSRMVMDMKSELNDGLKTIADMLQNMRPINEASEANNESASTENDNNMNIVDPSEPAVDMQNTESGMVTFPPPTPHVQPASGGGEGSRAVEESGGG